jgi:hypothetical protein
MQKSILCQEKIKCEKEARSTNLHNLALLAAEMIRPPLYYYFLANGKLYRGNKKIRGQKILYRILK